jgi:hypothetical protein
MRRGAGAGTSFVVALCLAQLCLAGDCVDGVTPDCSDAATQCGPDLDGSTFDGVAPSDSSSDARTDAAPPIDAANDADASTDADADASDQ